MPGEGDRPRPCYSYVPRNTRTFFGIIWNADGTPHGLVIDDVPYRVKPSPGLRIPLGDGATMQPNPAHPVGRRPARDRLSGPERRHTRPGAPHRGSGGAVRNLV